MAAPMSADPPPKPRTVVTRPEPLADEKKRPPRPLRAPLPARTELFSSGLIAERASLWSLIWSRYPRLGGAIMTLLCGSLFANAVSDDSHAFVNVIFGTFGRVHTATFYRMTAGGFMLGAWILSFGIPVDEKGRFLDWWKWGLPLAVLLTAGAGPYIAAFLIERL